MGVKILKKEYKNQYYQPDKVTDWLLGNVGDWQRLEITFEANIEFIGSSKETLSIDSVRNAIILNNGKNWNAYGFDLGDEVILSYTELTDPDNDGNFLESSYTLGLVIQNLYGDVMEVDEVVDFGGVDIIPTDRGNFKIKDVRIATVKEPEGIKLRYSHLTNDDFQNNNIRSIIDGSKTEFSFSGLDSLTPNIDKLMNPDGFQSGMPIERVFIKKLETSGSSYDEELNLIGEEVINVYTLKIRFYGNTVFYQSNNAVSIPLTKIGTNNEFKNSQKKQIPADNNQDVNSIWKNGDIDSIFLTDAQTSGVRYFDLNTSFTLSNTNDNSNSDFFNLCLFRYKDGSSLNFVEKIDLATYNNASDFKGDTIQFNNVIAVNLNVGDSLALGISYFHIPQHDVRRYIDVKVNYANIKAIEQSQGGGIGNTYMATIDFMMPLVFDLPSDLENNTLPAPLFNSGSLTDNFELDLYPEWNNPNTIITNNTDYTERLGNTGWFNENFNGLDNNFKVKSLIYKDEDGNILQQLDYNSPVIVEAVVSGVKNLNSNSRFGFGFSWIPQEEEDYKDNNYPYHKNLLINTGRKYTDGINDSFGLSENLGTNIFKGNSVTNARMDVMAVNGVLFSPNAGDEVKMTAKFMPTAEFTQLFNNKPETDRNYVLWVSVADSSKRINFSDRVNILLDYNEMVKFIPPAGEYPNMTAKFLEHPQNENVDGVDKYKGFIEDDILSHVEFRINVNDDVNVRDMVFGYEVENINTGATYTLESYTVNLSTFGKDVNGVQNFNINESRGFKLNDNNNKNWVKVLRNDRGDNGDNKAYVAYFGTKIRWEDWIKRDNVPIEFFDVNKPNDGYNNNWLDYLRSGEIGDYRINFFVNTQLIQDGEFKSYKNAFEITFNGYDENANIETTHEYYRNSDNTLLNIGNDPITGKPLGVLLNDEPTRIEITYTNLVEDMSVSELYGVIGIEIDGGPGEFEYRQLSSVWDSENDNILVPLISETKLKMEQISPNTVKTSCLVDNNRLSDALRYKVSGRIGCFTDGNVAPNAGKYEARYEDIYE